MSLVIIVLVCFFSQKRLKGTSKKKHSSSFPRLKEYENSRLLSHPLARPFVVKEEEKDLIKRRI